MKYRKGYKYQVAETTWVQTDIYPEADIDTHFVSLTKKGVLTVRDGYASDGPSGPTIDTRSSIRGAIFHDALYELMRKGLLASYWRSHADGLAYEIWIEDGMWKWRAMRWYRAISSFAGSFADPKHKKRIYTTP